MKSIPGIDWAASVAAVRWLAGGRVVWIPFARILVFWSLVFWSLAAPLPAVAQVPPASREELMRKWDIDRDGKVDASEAEIARSRMRRARTDAIMSSGNDPVTGRPRAAIDPVTGRPREEPGAAAGRVGLPAADGADENGLILVPGTGERPEGLGGEAAKVDSAAARQPPPVPSSQSRPGLPGTRAPVPTAAIPSTTPQLPAAGQRRPPPNGGSPGVISGGVRAGGLPGRSGMAPGAAPNDLNAGRLPAGLPQTRGTPPGTVAGSRMAPTIPRDPAAGMRGGPAGVQAAPAGPLGSRVPPNGRPAAAAADRPGMMPSRGLAPTTSPQAGLSGSRTPQVPPPATGRRPLQPQTPVPRPPRMTTDEFYGR